ncbi:MAG: RNA polymerase sigma factor [Clostridium sp.]|nr:RNA polymerase sigma factor [Clostridium sp.]
MPENKRKFAILYEKYRYLMQKVAMDVLHDPYLAEDAVHNAFMKLAKHMWEVGEADGLSTKRYLITITKNAAIDIYRKRSRQRHKELYMDELGEGELPMSHMETGMDNPILDVLKNLPVKYRDIFLLKYSAQLKNSEIAKICGIKEATVRQRIARGKALIERELKKQEENGSGTEQGNG